MVMGPVPWAARGVFAVRLGRGRLRVRLLAQRGTRLPEGVTPRSMHAPAPAPENPLIVVGGAHEASL
jgi:hypothetical protein